MINTSPHYANSNSWTQYPSYFSTNITASSTSAVALNNFYFNFDTNTIIEGILIEVGIDPSSTAGTLQEKKIYINTTRTGDSANRATMTTLVPGNVYSYGGPTDTFGLTLQPADLSDLYVYCEYLNGIAFPSKIAINFVRVTVFYTAVDSFDTVDNTGTTITNLYANTPFNVTSYNNLQGKWDDSKIDIPYGGTNATSISQAVANLGMVSSPDSCHFLGIPTCPSITNSSGIASTSQVNSIVSGRLAGGIILKGDIDASQTSLSAAGINSPQTGWTYNVTVAGTLFGSFTPAGTFVTFDGTNWIAWGSGTKVTGGTGILATGNYTLAIDPAYNFAAPPPPRRLPGAPPVVVTSFVPSITTLGTITTGTWKSSAVQIPYGGLAAVPAAPVPGHPAAPVPTPTADISLKNIGGCPIKSPKMTGTPTVPDQTQGDSSTAIANTAFVSTKLHTFDMTGKIRHIGRLDGYTGFVTVDSGTLAATGLINHGTTLSPSLPDNLKTGMSFLISNTCIYSTLFGGSAWSGSLYTGNKFTSVYAGDVIYWTGTQWSRLIRNRSVPNIDSTFACTQFIPMTTSSQLGGMWTVTRARQTIVDLTPWIIDGPTSPGVLRRIPGIGVPDTVYAKDIPITSAAPKNVLYTGLINGFVSPTWETSPVPRNVLTNISSGVGIPYNTTCLINGNSLSPIDSISATDFTNSNVILDSNKHLYGTGSLTFDGTSSYLNNADSSIAQFSADFTLEFWLYITTLPSVADSDFVLFDNRTLDGSTTGLALVINKASNTLEFRTNTSAFAAYYNAHNRSPISGITPYLNAWHHVSLCRKNDTIYLNMDGFTIGYYVDTASFQDGPCYIGRKAFEASGFFLGNMSDFRIINGKALYTKPSSTGIFLPLTGTTCLENLSYTKTKLKDYDLERLLVKVDPPATRKNPTTLVTESWPYHMTGVPTAPTAPADTWSPGLSLSETIKFPPYTNNQRHDYPGQIATTEFVLNQASTYVPYNNSDRPAAGSGYRFSRADHIHPTDTSRLPLDNANILNTTVTATTTNTSTHISTVTTRVVKTTTCPTPLGTHIPGGATIASIDISNKQIANTIWVNQVAANHAQKFIRFYGFVDSSNVVNVYGSCTATPIAGPLNNDWVNVDSTIQPMTGWGSLESHYGINWAPAGTCLYAKDSANFSAYFPNLPYRVKVDANQLWIIAGPPYVIVTNKIANPVIGGYNFPLVIKGAKTAFNSPSQTITTKLDPDTQETSFNLSDLPALNLIYPPPAIIPTPIWQTLEIKHTNVIEIWHGESLNPAYDIGSMQGIKMASTNSSHAYITSTDSKFGSKCFYSDGGGEFASNPSETPLAFSDNCLQFWCKLLPQPDPNLPCVVASIITEYYGRQLTWHGIQLQNGTLRYQPWYGTAIDSGVNPCDGNWHYVVLTRKGNVMTLFVDNSKVSKDYSSEGLNWVMRGSSWSVSLLSNSITATMTYPRGYVYGTKTVGYVDEVKFTVGSTQGLDSLSSVPIQDTIWGDDPLYHETTGYITRKRVVKKDDLLNTGFSAFQALTFDPLRQSGDQLTPKSPVTASSPTPSLTYLIRNFQLNALTSTNIDVSSVTCASLTVSGPTSLTFSNWPAAGQGSYIFVSIDNGGSSSITWPANINFIKSDGSVQGTPWWTLQTSGTDYIAVWSNDGGASLWAKLIRSNQTYASGGGGGTGGASSWVVVGPGTTPGTIIIRKV